MILQKIFEVRHDDPFRVYIVNNNLIQIQIDIYLYPVSSILISLLVQVTFTTDCFLMIILSVYDLLEEVNFTSTDNTCRFGTNVLSDDYYLIQCLNKQMYQISVCTDESCSNCIVAGISIF